MKREVMPKCECAQDCHFSLWEGTWNVFDVPIRDGAYVDEFYPKNWEGFSEDEIEWGIPFKGKVAYGLYMKTEPYIGNNEFEESPPNKARSLSRDEWKTLLKFAKAKRKEIAHIEKWAFVDLMFDLLLEPFNRQLLSMGDIREAACIAYRNP